MRVRINIGLDFDGMHTFEWEPSDAPGAVDVPRPTLDRWAEERECFKVAFLRWKHVVEEVEDYLYRAEQSRGRDEAEVAPAVALAAALAAKK